MHRISISGHALGRGHRLLRPFRLPRPAFSRELDGVVVEVTVLTVPREIGYDDPRSLPGMVHIGEDGLIIECMGRRGLLLPQVPVEWGWDAETFLRHLSMKAGLLPDAWTWDGARIWSFGGEVFSETSPRGDIVRRDI